MSFKVTYYTQPFRGGKVFSQEYKARKGKPLSEFMHESIGADIDLVVFENGVLVDKDIHEIFPENKQQFAVVPIPKGGSWKRDDWKFLFNIAMMAGMFLIPGGSTLWGIKGATWSKIAMGVGTIGNYFWPSSPPKKFTDSTAYSWDISKNNSASHNTPMPILYGKTKVKPVIKNEFITNMDGKQYKYILYSLMGHMIDELDTTDCPIWNPNNDYHVGDIVKSPIFPGMSFRCIQDAVNGENISTSGQSKYWGIYNGTANITSTDILIGGNPITKYMGDGNVRYETRIGSTLQTVIAGFDATFQHYPSGEDANRLRLPLFTETSTIFPQLYIQYLSYLGTEYHLGGVAFPFSSTYCYWSPTDTDRFYTTGGGDKIEVAYKSNNVWHYLWDTQAPKTDEWLVIDTYDPLTQDIQVDLYFPAGLYHQKANGDVTEQYCYIYAQYKRTFDENGVAVNEAWSNDLYLTSGQDYYWTDSLHVIDSSGVVCKQHKFRYKTPTPFYITLKHCTTSDHWNTLPTGQYQVRICALSPTPVLINDVATITYGEEGKGFSYPGEALLGIIALATGQLNGDFDTTVVVERSKVWVYTGTQWVQKNANNHAWAVYDILVNGCDDHPANDPNDTTNLMIPYGCGLDPSHVDYDSFSEWADYIDSLGFTLNIVFDTFMTRWEAILRICREGCGMVSAIGTTVYAIVDKPTTYSQLVTVGNTAQDSYSESWANQEDRPNIIEVTFWNKERQYDQTTITVRGSTWDLDSRSDAQQLQLYGTTDFDQAYAIARRILNCNEKLSQLATLKRDVDSLGAEIGDVIRLQCDVAQWGEGGRLVKVEENLVLNGTFEWGSGVNPNFLFDNWDIWHVADRGRSTDKHWNGSYSYYHLGASVACGLSQTFEVEPNTEYTYSCYLWNLGGSTSLRIWALVDGSYLYTQFTKTGQWEQLVLTFTTGATQTSLTIFLGGEGEGYFDSAQVEKGNTPTDFMWGSRLTLDKEITILAGQSYRVMVTPKSTGVPVEMTVIGDTGTNTSIRLWNRFVDLPEVYDVYAFGIVDAYFKEFRIIDIDRSEQMYRTLIMQEYDASVYTIGTTPTLDLPDKTIFNDATNIQLVEVLSQRSTGEYESSVMALWEQETGDAFGMWDVYWRDVDVSDTGWRGEWDSSVNYNKYDLVYYDGNVYLSMIDENSEEPTP